MRRGWFPRQRPSLSGYYGIAHATIIRLPRTTSIGLQQIYAQIGQRLTELGTAEGLTKMRKIAVLLTIGLALPVALRPQNPEQMECIRRCTAPDRDPDMDRQEIINLEREAARAILLSDGTFFRRVYGDDFSGTLSHGEPANKAEFISAVQSTAIKYESFNASDIKVHIYRETAVATCMWSARGVVKGQHMFSQMRVIHVYVNTSNGWKVVSGQATLLPPYTPEPL